jgi:uncharacterized protein YaaR (DUF327 family)
MDNNIEGKMTAEQMITLENCRLGLENAQERLDKYNAKIAKYKVIQKEYTKSAIDLIKQINPKKVIPKAKDLDIFALIEEIKKG